VRDLYLYRAVSLRVLPVRPSGFSARRFVFLEVDELRNEFMLLANLTAAFTFLNDFSRGRTTAPVICEARFVADEFGCRTNVRCFVSLDLLVALFSCGVTNVNVAPHLG